MANPNRCMAYVPKRSPVEKKSFRSRVEASVFADEMRAAGYDVKETMRRYGSRKAPMREFNVFAYNKMSKA